MPDLDVCGIGSALVDVLVEASVKTVEACGLVKGSMQLMDLERAEEVHARVPGGVERSGGSVANAAAGLASLGARTGFIGKVADDRFGAVFEADLTALGVEFGRANGTGATGRCLILITPDADRTMCTTLGVAATLGPDDLDDGLIARSSVTYLEGYLWDEPQAKDAFRRAITVAHGAGRRVAMSMSDPFCVERHRGEFAALAADHLDILFGNEAELCSLMEVDDLAEAVRRVRRPGLLVSVTRGPLGAWVFEGTDGPVAQVPVEGSPDVVDTTGAGDLFAAGFLYGLCRGSDLEACARLGNLTASEVISHVGARPERDLGTLAAAYV
ncbi:MAG TPA: adenosine kinase [Acidimicrobiales bacterium]|nr:adenosine kinase [Acidimicrobiales bacterium]